MLGYHLCSSNGRVNFSDATFLQNDVLVPMKHLFKLREFLVHRNDNTYLHACFLFAYKGNKKAEEKRYIMYNSINSSIR